MAAGPQGFQCPGRQTEPECSGNMLFGDNFWDSISRTESIFPSTRRLSALVARPELKFVSLHSGLSSPGGLPCGLEFHYLGFSICS